ncbi:hypothetical protein FOFC_02490 [Fusarium oxysporum]|nr:hypothetical protein FOFC_02481 [Fusarium oxysporum]KAI8416181.1 hypothetical protein FOFC_02490 [Fusarium oxysporum]
MSILSDSDAITAVDDDGNFRSSPAPSTAFTPFSPARRSKSTSPDSTTKERQYEESLWRRFPGFTWSQRVRDTNSWAWEYGYDIQKGNDRKWVCKICIRKNTLKPKTFTSTGIQNTLNHLYDDHRICAPEGKTKSASQLRAEGRKAKGQSSIAELMKLDTNNVHDKRVQQTSEILLALRALQNDPKLSLRRAAGIYQVRYWTLHRRQKGILSTRDSIPKSRKLSDLEEQIIVQFILDLDSRGFPPRLRCVEEMANRLLADREMPPVGKRWASNFVKRHKDLKTHFFRKYDYQRAKCEDPTIIRNWFRLVANVIAKYGIRPDEIYNFDETGFMMGVIASGMVVTGAERRGRPKSVQPGNREWITVIQAINAEGQAIPPNLPGDWAIATSPNGWTDNEIGLEWLKHFDRCTTKQSKNRYRLLILDGHESHHSVDVERYCKANKIITLCMPPHSSHLLQPLDVGCFGLLKKAYGREIEHLIRCSVTHISKTEFFPAFYTAYQATMTEKNIKAAFRGAGLAPLDPESVISKLDVQLRTPTPAKEVVSPSTPWVSKTPKTILEADSQLEYLERRIKRHKSSSPESILEALRSSSKGTKIVMHKVALLEARVQDLEQANEILSRRRRAKRTRLQKGGVMTVEEGRQVIDQTDVDAQAVAGPSRSGGQGGPARRKERRCRACGKTGHNVRTCQIVVAMSLEEYSG